MMEELWIARDDDGTLAQYFEREPVLEGGDFSPSSPHYGFRILPKGWFPNINPGECRKAKITLEAEK